MNENETPFDFYAETTRIIIEQLEKGIVPWERCWKYEQLPRNFRTKERYENVNLLLLAHLNYESPYYIAEDELPFVHAEPFKGEAPHLILFIRQEQKSDNSTEVWFQYQRVYNVEQCFGISIVELEVPASPKDPIKTCCRIIENFKSMPAIKHQPWDYQYDDQVDGRPNETYNADEDTIVIPEPHEYVPEGYYYVLFHLLIHATGHASRLNRKAIVDKLTLETEGAAYEQEQIIAAMGRTYLQAHTHIMREYTAEDTYPYIKQQWVTHFRSNKQYFLEATVDAQRAFDYITNFHLKPE